MMASYPDRVFQLWDYRVSHQRLLLRCPKRSGDERNIDISFYGVGYVASSTVLRGLELHEASVEQRHQLGAILTEAILRERKVFNIRSMGQEFFVVAADVRIDENDLEHQRSPFDSTDG